MRSTHSVLSHFLPQIKPPISVGALSVKTGECFKLELSALLKLDSVNQNTVHPSMQEHMDDTVHHNILTQNRSTLSRTV